MKRLGETNLNNFLNELCSDFYDTFIAENRWKLFTNGAKTTLTVTFFALIIGIVFGFLIAIVRTSYDKANGKKNIILTLLNGICKVYLTIIRGTPVLVQLMIIFYIIFGSSNNRILASIIAFGLNSAAYVAEIVRSGIQSIDKGQFEAGRSLGFNYPMTMWLIIIPQAFKNILPALANEFIVLIKETSVSAMIGLADLTYGANLIRSRTYEAFFPLIALALIYLVMVMILEKGVAVLERRLASSDH